jgi:hypothetical protein
VIDARTARSEAKMQRALRDLLLAQYVGSEATAMARTNACILLGHPAKHPIKVEHKQDWERGCPCGHRDWL